MSQKYEAKKWKIKTFFFETSVDFLFPSPSIDNSSIEMEKRIDGKQNTHFPWNVSTAIRWHQTMKQRNRKGNERKGLQEAAIVRESAREREPTHLLHVPERPVGPALCSAVTLIKRRPPFLSIWPVSPSPVKGNRLAEHRHYIIICRCRQAQTGERRETWYPRRKRETLASIFLTLTLNHGGKDAHRRTYYSRKVRTWNFKRNCKADGKKIKNGTTSIAFLIFCFQ